METLDINRPLMLPSDETCAEYAPPAVKYIVKTLY
jgi:hypothetical protein